MLTIDGSQGEGGGQIIRSALALSLVTGTPFRIEKIRARRLRPGLMRQHLTAVNAAAQLGRAEVSGAEVGASHLTFIPRTAASGGNFRFDVGTAGSTTLVLQTILPALMLAGGPSNFVLEGGTHNMLAPPFEFLDRAFLPVVNALGPKVSLRLERHGFYPAGGGRIAARIEPAPRLRPLRLLERGALRACRARAIVSHLNAAIAQRELNVVAHSLRWPADDLKVEAVDDSPGPGNVLLLEVESEHVTEVFAGFGERGVRAETVAEGAVAQVRHYLAAGVPVGSHLADQLMIPLALAGEGAFRTGPLTSHTQTQRAVIRAFLGRDLAGHEVARGVWQVGLKA